MDKSKQRQIIIALGLLTVGFSLLLIKGDILRIFRLNNEESYTIISFTITIISIVIALTGATRILFDYLQGNITSSKSPENIDLLSRKVKELEDTVKNFQHIDFTKEANEIINNRINNIATDEFVKGIENKYEDKLFENYKLNTITNQLSQINQRLESETRRIARSASINLTLGFATTIFAIAFLTYSLLLTDDTSKLIADEIKISPDFKTILPLFLIKFLPRLSVSIFIELFSFFFLRIYKRNLEDIKYLNNERTNIEVKLLSLNTALISKDTTALNAILIELSKTERNYILRAGETTSEIEKSKLENSVYKDTLDNIVKAIKK